MGLFQIHLQVLILEDDILLDISPGYPAFQSIGFVVIPNDVLSFIGVGWDDGLLVSVWFY